MARMVGARRAALGVGPMAGSRSARFDATLGVSSELERRWPAVLAVARLPLRDGPIPTPVEHLAALSRHVGSDVWIKRDDRTSDRYGGNKVRKLEWLLGRARERGSRAVLTSGVIGSNHVLATGVHGRALGLRVHAVVGPRPDGPGVLDNVRAALAQEVVLEIAQSYPAMVTRSTEVFARLARAGDRPLVIAPGGSSPRGVLGYVEGALELAAQVRAGQLPLPDAIFAAAGTGGTVAGIALGLALAGLPVPVIGARVTPPPFSSKAWMTGLVRGASRLLRKADRDMPDVAALASRLLDLDADALGAGYGVPTPAGTQAITLAHDLESLHLEQTYTGKTMASLLRRARERRGTYLFWHTYSSAPLAPLLAGAPEISPELRALIRS